MNCAGFFGTIMAEVNRKYGRVFSLPWVGSSLGNLILFFVISLFSQCMLCLGAFQERKILLSTHLFRVHTETGIKNLSFMTEMGFFFLFLAHI